MGDETDDTNDKAEAEALHSQRGKFTVAMEVVQDAPTLLMQVLRDVLVLGCAFSYVDRVFRYEGVSPHFHALEDGEQVPSYDMAYDEDTSETTWTRTEGA